MTRRGYLRGRLLPLTSQVHHAYVTPQVYEIQFHRHHWFICSVCGAEANARDGMLHSCLCPVGHR